MMESMVQMVNQQMQAHYARNQPSPPPSNVPPPPVSRPGKDSDEEVVESAHSHDKSSAGIRFPGSFFKGVRSRSASSPSSPLVHGNGSHSAAESADADGSEMSESGQRVTSVFYDLKLEPPRDLTLRQKWQTLAVNSCDFSYVCMYVCIVFFYVACPLVIVSMCVYRKMK
jgi:hypothetical protein